MGDTSKAQRRVLVVEDEYLIRMLLEDMLADLGYDVAAAVGSIAEASEHATKDGFGIAILDVNLDGQEIYPVADILAKRGLPYVFVTGYGERSLPDPHRGRPLSLVRLVLRIGHGPLGLEHNREPRSRGAPEKSANESGTPPQGARGGNRPCRWPCPRSNAKPSSPTPGSAS